MSHLVRGHRRTQSANLANSMSEEPRALASWSSQAHHDNNILHLLNKCQVNAKEKVCNVDNLQLVPTKEDDKMFNFGKGLLKVSLQSR